jgi:hypothetical protein
MGVTNGGAGAYATMRKQSVLAWLNGHLSHISARSLCIRIWKARTAISFALLVSFHSNHIRAQQEPFKNSIDFSVRGDLRELLGTSMQRGRIFYLILELPDQNGLIDGQVLAIRAEGDGVCIQSFNCLTLFFYRASPGVPWSKASSILPPLALLSHEEYFFDKRRYRLLVFGRDNKTKFVFVSGEDVLISDYQNITR